MASKCVHKGCGKVFSDPEEPCKYHPGPPDFHEGQKGWKCCKPRVLTFDEFLEIPPCTTGKHSAVDDTPKPEPKQPAAEPALLASQSDSVPSVPPKRLPQTATASPRPTAAAVAPPPESDSDEPSTPLPSANVTCKRKGCGASSTDAKADRSDESCVYHPGQAVFHEGSKGWSCCKRRVLEFDEFMRIPGCKTRTRHCFVGKRKKAEGNGAESLEKVNNIRHDFYQTSTTVHASLFLKKIDKEQSKVDFQPDGFTIALDLKTSDGKWHNAEFPLYGQIDPASSAYKILGTKLELTLAKTDGMGWPVLRSDEKLTGEIIQTGRAGRA